MSAILVKFKPFCLISITAALLGFFIGPTFAQQLIVHHPPIPIVVPLNQPSFSPPPNGGRPSATPRVPAPLATQVTSSCSPGLSQPAPLVAIVVALKCDPDLIFEYVYNNIEFEPLYGSNKGPLGTLLDRRGDDADQAILLVTLWNIAGYTQTGYANLAYLLSGAQLANWSGVENDANSNITSNALVQLINGGGIPYCPPGATTCTPPTLNADNTIKQIELLHFIAALQLNGTWYFFDPSYKQQSILSGISGLASALGYSRNQLLSDAGETVRPTNKKLGSDNAAQYAATSATTTRMLLVAGQRFSGKASENK